METERVGETRGVEGSQGIAMDVTEAEGRDRAWARSCGGRETRFKAEWEIQRSEKGRQGKAEMKTE